MDGDSLRLYDAAQSALREEDGEERLNPTEQVRFILNLNGGGEESHHSVFTELEELCTEEGQTEWKETARWLKFVEVAEPGGQKWSKPHVSTLAMHSLFQLRDLLLKAVILLDESGKDMPQIADTLLDEMVMSEMLELRLKEKVYTALTRKHMHPPPSSSRRSSLDEHPPASRSSPDEHLPASRSSPDEHPPASRFSPDEHPPASRSSLDETAVAEFPSRSQTVVKQPPKLLLNMPMVPDLWKIMRKIPQGSEICNVLVGEMESLADPIVGFVRLAESVVLQEVTDMPLPIRFLFVLIGPIGSKSTYLDVGRAFATLMSDEVFREVAYKATSSADLLSGMDEFMDKATVLPPSQWDPTIRVDPPCSIPSIADRLNIHGVPRPSRQASARGGGGGGGKRGGGGGGEGGGTADPRVQFYKVPFAGIVSDFMARHRRYYWSDIRDGFNVQVIASIIFVFFANVTPAVSFGGLLLTITDQNLGPVESILSVGIANFIFALLSAQPQMILGASGASLVFEGLVYTFCKQNGLSFFSFRFWISFWAMILCTLIAAFNLSAILRIFTRFTEEIYTCLVAFIFAYDSITKLLALEPAGLDSVQWLTCWDTGLNASSLPSHLSRCTRGVAWISTTNMAKCSNRTIQALSYVSPDKVLNPFPNCSIGTLERSSLSVVSSGVFVMSFVLYIGTFLTAFCLKQFRVSQLCTNFIRRHVSSFAILISVIIWVAIDQIVGYPTKKLIVPKVVAGESLFAEKSGRTTADFVINPLGNGLQTWAVFAAFLPGLLLTILFFMDTQITALVVNRKDYKMKKPGGYHFDFLLVGIIGFIHGILGLPFVTGAIVRSITGIQSLQVYAPAAAPGEKLKYLGVIEQRITGIGLGILASLSILAYPVLQLLPLALLYGVFFFIGVSALFGVQFIERLFLFITPHKYWPDYKYLRNIRNWRMYLYTALQLGLLCFLCIFKGVPQLNIAFPAMIILLVIGRYFVGCMYTYKEMELMDNVIPLRLYPKFARQMKSRVDIVIQDTVSRKSFSTVRRGQMKCPVVGGATSGTQMVTQTNEPELTRYRDNDDQTQQASPSYRNTAV